jgi:hypothetical protein
MFLILQKICENVDANQPTPKRATRKQKKQTTPPSSDISLQSKASSTSESSNINSPEKKKLRSKMKPIRLLASDEDAGNDRNQKLEDKTPMQHNLPIITDQTSVQYTDHRAADDVSPD